MHRYVGTTQIWPGQTPRQACEARRRSHLRPPDGQSRVEWLKSSFDEASLRVKTLTGAMSAARAWEQEARLAAEAMLDPERGERCRGGPWCDARPISKAWKQQIRLVHECTSSSALRALAGSCPAVRWHFGRQPQGRQVLGWSVAAVQSPRRSGRSGRSGTSGRSGRSGSSNWVGHPKRRAYPRKRPAAAVHQEQEDQSRRRLVVLPGPGSRSGKPNWAGHPERRRYARKRPAASGAQKRKMRRQLESARNEASSGH